MDIGDLKNTVSAYLSTTAGAMVVNGVDLCLLALNNARRTAELAHDFYYSKTNLSLSISSTGGDISTAASSSVTSLTVSGSLTPDITGIWTQAGYYNGLPMYSIFENPVFYVLFYSGTAWIMSDEGFNPTDYYGLTTASASPNGTYTAAGSYTGSPVVSGAPELVGIKRIQDVLLPLSSGDLVPIEFLTVDDWNGRVQRQIGRQRWNPRLTIYQLGVSADNPVCYQQGQKLFLVPPSQFSFPVSATLSVIQWLPDYAADTDTDFFTEFGPEYLQWQGIIEGNKLLETFVQRREGNLDETNLQTESAAALGALIAWDDMISGGTSTPTPAVPTAPPQ